MAVNQFGSKTDTGNVREHNEDSILVNEAMGLWAVADGMGGHESGEVASAIACDVLNKQITAGAGLSTAIQAAHHEIISAGKANVGSVGMGTTIVALQVHDNDFEVAWVGDSRIYLWNGTLRQISKDHSLVQKLLDSGAITPEAARNHPDSNLIYQCLGTVDMEDVDVDHIGGQFLRNQKILLCSDGLSDEVDDDSIAKIFADGGADQELCEKLVQAALDNTGKDNISVVIVSAPEDAPVSIETGDTQPLKTQAFNSVNADSNHYKLIIGVVLFALVAVALFILS